MRAPLRRGLCGACYERARHRRTAYGTWDPDRTAADPVRDHVARLESAGVSHRRLVELAGVSRSVLQTLLHGKPGREAPQQISHATAAKILAVAVPETCLEVAADHAVVPGIGTQRRLQALVAIGYPQARLAAELGVRPSNFGSLIHSDSPVIARRHREVAELFDRLEMTPGPSLAARAYARARRWALPMQWDPETIDDPDARRLRVRRIHRARPSAGVRRVVERSR
ncbi:hypothetical protein GZH49_02895 [Nocardia terpenica]|uniref:hypothetical protein n=1 Tax=Nocardia terpenica TaxID=455432 RepID=UPI002FDF533A